MKKLVWSFVILSAIPGIILIPLAPFTFFLVDGEGRVPGLFHEHAFMALLLLYPFLLAGCLWFAWFSLRRGRAGGALMASAAPFLCAVLLVWVFIAGGVQLN